VGRHSDGHSDRHHFGRLETKREKRERLMLEAQKRIVELERQVAVSRRVALTVINLLAPYVAGSMKGGRQ
jgi:hypothetical protein